MESVFIATPEEAAQRLDKLLAAHFPVHSRTYFQFLIEHGAVLVNGKRLKKREKVHEGDEVEVYFLLTPEIALAPEAIPLDILYEDETLLAINKPAGMVVHPAPGHPHGTFVNALLHHCKSLKSADWESLRPGIVHRLDKDTSGVLIAAKTIAAHQQLVTLFAERKVKKEYRAICVGLPPEGLIDAPIARHRTHRQQMDVCLERGKEAKTRVRVLGHKSPLSSLSCELITGRTHQIRVHLKHLKTPILGDPVYGSISANKKFHTPRQMLHAACLSLTHPFSGQLLELQAPLPEDFKAVLETFCEEFKRLLH